MKIIAIANQKGGTAKTTTTAALGVILARRGIPVHLVDMDSQASLTRAFRRSRRFRSAVQRFVRPRTVARRSR